MSNLLEEIEALKKQLGEKQAEFKAKEDYFREGNRRLMLLVTLLKGLPRDRFNFNKWVGDDWQGKEDLSCGTQACAMGWATTIPELRAAGLRMSQDLGTGRGRIFVEGQSEDAGHNHGALAAAAEIFHISLANAYHLFMPRGAGGYSGFSAGPLPETATPKQVAKEIEKFVKAREKELKR